MRAETGAEQRRFYAVATWVVPASVPLPCVLVYMASGGLGFLALGIGVVVLVGVVLAVRFGRSGVAGLVVGTVLGGLTALAGLVGAFWLGRLGVA